MIQNINALYSEAQRFITLFDQFVEKYQLKGEMVADHICYKCDSRENYEAIRTMLEPHIDFLYQSMVAGRHISYVRLIKPIQTLVGPIFFLELSDQKPNGSQKDGFDHIEVFPEFSAADLDCLLHILDSQKVAIKESTTPHHKSFETPLASIFDLKISSEPLIEKIVRDEILKK